jgi:hypothetical protein
VYITRGLTFRCQKRDEGQRKEAHLTPSRSTSHSARIALSASARIPWSSIGTPFQRTSIGRAVASAEAYAHSSTRSVSPGLSNTLAMRLHLKSHGIRVFGQQGNPKCGDHVCALHARIRRKRVEASHTHPSVLPVWTSVDQSSYAGAYMRSVNSRMNFCNSAWPVAGLYCNAVVRLSPPSPGRGSRGM